MINPDRKTADGVVSLQSTTSGEFSNYAKKIDRSLNMLTPPNLLLKRVIMDGEESGRWTLQEVLTVLPSLTRGIFAAEYAIEYRRDKLSVVLPNGGEPIYLTRQENVIFGLLYDNFQKVVTSTELNISLGYGWNEDLHPLRVMLGKLRAKLGDEEIILEKGRKVRRYIQTVYGVGYQLNPYSPSSNSGPARVSLIK